MSNENQSLSRQTSTLSASLMQGDGSPRIRSTVAADPNAIKTNNSNDIGAKKSLNIKKTDGNGKKIHFFSRII